ncbi:MAG TPA: HAMP domain-containing sensor histidine kinase [Candidatus Binatia bacterium]|nr:HAMP domain-containing sensor histidine kinase [Candidatus Binatia bacterium]
MSLRQQQVAVFCGTVVVIFGILGAGIWLVAQRLTTEATLQTALLMARQVEIALADSLRERSIVVTPRSSPRSSSGFWSFLGNLFPGQNAAPSGPTRYTPPRHAEVKGLMKAFVDRSASITAMWVVNAEGAQLYSSVAGEKKTGPVDHAVMEKLRRGEPIIEAKQDGNSSYYDVWVPLQMPAGVRSPGGLRLWINPSDWTGLLSGLWHQFILLFALGGIVALLSAFVTTALYTRRFRLISETLRQAEAGTYAARPRYASRDEVGASLDLIDRLVMKQRKQVGIPAPTQRLAIAARTLAHEVKTPLNALAIHLEVLRKNIAAEDNGEQSTRSLAALDSSIRQVDRLVRDFSDYSAPVTMERKPIDVAEVLATSLDAIGSACAAKKIHLTARLDSGPWPVLGDATRLRQTFDNLLRNAIEAQPGGGEIEVEARRNGNELIVDISDAGPGVPLERRAEIFEFGKTTKAGGSGIGLPLSQLIVESHGGSLTCQDRNGAGSGATFRIALPLEAAH